MDSSNPDPSEAAFEQLETYRARAVRNMVASLVILPVNVGVIVKTIDSAPAVALASLMILNTLQLITGIQAKRAGEAALRARTADMSPPRGARRAIVLGGLAAAAAICFWILAALGIAAVLSFKPPHY